MTSRASRHRWTTAYFAASVATCSKTRYRRRVSMRTASRALARGWRTRTRVPMIDSRCTSTNSVHFSATCRTNWTIFRFVVSTSRMAVRSCTVWALPNSTKDNVSTRSCNVRTPVVPWSSTDKRWTNIASSARCADCAVRMGAAWSWVTATTTTPRPLITASVSCANRWTSYASRRHGDWKSSGWRTNYDSTRSDASCYSERRRWN